MKYKKKINVMVTGAGSAVGQGIIKSLKLSKMKVEIYASDISPLNAGLYFVKNSIIIPKVEKKNSLKKILNILIKKKIHVLFIGSEYEVEFFSKYKFLIEKKTNTLVHVSNFKTVKLGNDKYLTHIFLKKNGFITPLTYRVEKNKKKIKYEKLYFPCILKSRTGTSSRQVYLIKNIKDLKTKLCLVKNAIVQNFCGEKGSNKNFEFTAGIFVDKNKKINGPIILKRQIKYGTTWVSEVHKNKVFSSYLKKITNLLDVTGSINFQFFSNNGKPEIFEINSRISGSCPIRAHYGFNEPEMFIRSFYLDQPINKIKIKNGVCLRFNEELYLKKKNIRSLNKNF